ncbi:MAG: LysM peptidoglycan-binding domain-containing protein [Planctomycetota bacterium]|jgi:LysM repeat protein
MSTLEKFGILVILILVVVIGVVAVWGVGGEEGVNPFEPGNGDNLLVDAGDQGEAGNMPGVDDLDLPPWPGGEEEVKTLPPAPAPRIDVTPPGGHKSLIKNTPVVPGPRPGVDDDNRPRPAADGNARIYTVKKGDTLTGIASSLGLSDWQDLLEANPHVDPRSLAIGTELRLPGHAADAPVTKDPPRKAGPNPDDGPTGSGRFIEYRIRKGDTLSTVSQDLLGTSTKWHRILEANPGLNANRLRIGQVIRVPVAE